MLNIISIKATTIPDAWHQLILSIMDNGKPFIIDEGSYSGNYRLEFDYVTIQIIHPEVRPFEPELPFDMQSAGIPAPVAPGYIDEYVSYIMTPECKPDEDYTYGQRLNAANVQRYGMCGLIFNQVQHVIDKYRTGKTRNNQLCMSVAQPGDMLKNDPPCLQSIDTRIQEGKLHFYPYFRSWDLWGGFPANLAGLQYLKEYMAAEIGCEPGETVASSKGLHIYRYVWELAEQRRNKIGYVAKFLEAVGVGNPICPICGAKTLRFQWYEVAANYQYWYCLKCDEAERFPNVFVKFNDEWIN